jgi:soluble cytochrome b562
MFEKSEKQFSVQKNKEEKIEVFPEKHEEAIKYVQELKAIREKEILTEEDLKRAEELIKKIERIFSPEISFESEKAKERLESLKNTPLWDKEKKQWNGNMSKEQELQDSDRFSHNQLLGVLAEAVTGNISEAKERLESLKNTPLWDKEEKQWNGNMNKEQELRDSIRFSGDQLLGVLAEAVTGNISEAKERLESLKNTPLWDKEEKQWNWYMNKEQGLQDSIRFSGDQLLGVLAEAVTGNISEAKERLESLKNTPLWDKEKKQWNWNMNKEQELQVSGRYSYAQLLGILAEAFDEKEEEFVEWFTKI